MASFKSVLSAIGHVMLKIFNPVTIQTAATIAEAALPGFSGLIQATASAVINAENAAIVAGQQTGSGPQKAALVTSQIEKIYTDFATQNGIPVIPENIKKWVDAVVAGLNSFPAPLSSTGNPTANPVPPEPQPVNAA